VRVIDVQLNRMEQILHSVHLGIVAVDEVLVSAADDDLTSDGDLVVLLIANRTAGFILEK
jgi:hypothetical protein